MSHTGRFVAIALALIAMTGAAFAHDFKAGKITIDHPWAQPTQSASAPAAVYFRIENAGAADRLVAVRAPAEIAGRAEIHDIVEADGGSRMRHATDGIAIPKGGKLAFEPGGRHVMLLDVAGRIEAGNRFPLTLVFEKSGEVVVEVWAQFPKSVRDAAAQHDHHAH